MNHLRFPNYPYFSYRYLNSCLKKSTNNFLRTKSMHNFCSNNNPISTTSSAEPWLIVGLGNPGKWCNSTRHNVGFEMVDRIAQSEGIPMRWGWSSLVLKALFGKGFIGDIPIMLAKPQTFMNLSGWAVGAIVSYYKIPLNQVLVIYDDMDLPFAKLRLLPKGGHGGHNGMKNIIDHLKGSRDFPRLRIGIGRPSGNTDPINYVLRPFTKEENQELDFVFQNGLEAVRILLLEGFDKSANYVNSAKPLKYDC
ncbi:esterase [Lithospermum erythrorhizon]|uniref:peptidyl-tRNA hydrolase n=1 Tax=Lithospermum erythrorhizon TaxID=34254 RepID=A0AAV3Q4E7_LITER